jgi:hypothetical protein
MKRDEDILKSLIIGDLIGSALEALLAKNKNGGETLGAIAGAVLLATFKAYENAKKTNLPVYIEKDGTVYETNASGETKFIKRIQEFNKIIPKNFQLK